MEEQQEDKKKKKSTCNRFISQTKEIIHTNKQKYM